MIPSRPRGPNKGHSTHSLLLRTFVLLQIFTSTVVSQKIVPSSGSSTFPQCAVNCPVLIQAQAACLPPSAPVSNDATYTSCYCQSSYLTTLHTEASTTCGSSCPSTSDQQLLVTWYGDFCAAGGKDVIDGSSTTTTTTSATASSTAAGATSTSQNSSVSSGSGGGGGGWFSTHYKWIIMVVVLAIGFSIIAAAGIYFKRRYDEKHQNLYHGDDRRHNQAMASGFLSQHSATRQATPQPEMWGPQQNVAHTRDLALAPVEEPAWVANSSRAGSTRSLVGPGTPRPIHSAARLSRASTSRLARDSPISADAVTFEESPHAI